MLDLVDNSRTETEPPTAAPSPSMSAAIVAPSSRAQADDRPWGVDVEAARTGDRDAFGRLYREFGRMVHAILLTRLRAADAEDAVHDVFVLALERINDLREDAASGGWLATIARHRATDLQRRARHRRASGNVDSEWPDDRPPTTCSLEQRAEIQRILTTIRELPETYRESMMMRLVEGMSGPEIADRLQLAPNSVRVHLHRGMTLLRERLQNEEDPGS